VARIVTASLTKNVNGGPAYCLPAVAECMQIIEIAALA
jgi:hypothetical protein